METSNTSEMISQETICGEPEHPNKDCKIIEIDNDSELKKAQSKEHITKIEQTRKNLIHAREVYFMYLSSQKMAHTKSSVRRKVVKGDDKSAPQPQPSSSSTSSSQPLTVGKTPQIMSKKKKVRHFQPGL